MKRPREGLPRFADRGACSPVPAGCRKVRRDDESRASMDDVPPSPASGRRQLTRGFAPRGGTMRAARSVNRGSRLAVAHTWNRVLARDPDPARRLSSGASGLPGGAARRAFSAVDTRRSSGIVEQTKKVAISRGFGVSYPSSPSSSARSRAPRDRFEGPAGAARRAPTLRGHGRNGGGGLRWSPAVCGVASEGGEATQRVARRADGPLGGMRLAGFAGRGATPRGGGSRAGSRRHERVRFGIGPAWIRPGRDAAHLFDGRLRARRERRFGA